MTNSKDLIKEINENKYDEILSNIYVDKLLLDKQKERYIKAIKEFESIYGENDVEVYSAPGRTEIGGNHTDHQHGLVLAASINLDAIGIVSKNDEYKINLKSEGYDYISIDLNDIDVKENETGTTISLIRGLAKAFVDNGYKIGGFNAYVTSDVLSGSGLSSSAAFEVLVGDILSGLYNKGMVSPIDIAKFSKFSENVYFGKPCGLMDQMACSCGNLVNIDFKNNEYPYINPVLIDFDSFGYSLCVVDTKGSHVDLTADYAAVPNEMKEVCAFFNKDVLREVDEEEFYQNIPALMDVVSDRALLRAMHIFDENKRVIKEVEAIKNKDFETFKKVLIASGRSSYELLQNVYSTSDPHHQGLSLALALTSKILKDDGAYRVHGGGFAGTIQAFVKNELVNKYKEEIEKVFKTGSCYVLKIRPVGGIKVM